jgi:hypothetical protein
VPVLCEGTSRMIRTFRRLKGRRQPITIKGECDKRGCDQIKNASESSSEVFQMQTSQIDQY